MHLPDPTAHLFSNLVFSHEDLLLLFHFDQFALNLLVRAVNHLEGLTISLEQLGLKIGVVRKLGTFCLEQFFDTSPKDDQLELVELLGAVLYLGEHTHHERLRDEDIWIVAVEVDDGYELVNRHAWKRLETGSVARCNELGEFMDERQVLSDEGLISAHVGVGLHK